MKGETQTFRGKTMQAAVALLKERLGPDAIIIGTVRGEDMQGRYVEIQALAEARVETAAATARYKPGPAPAWPGGRPGAVAAYASTAATSARAPATAPAPAPAPAPKASTANHAPFAERAALLSRRMGLPVSLPPAPRESIAPAESPVTRSSLDALATALTGEIRSLRALVLDRGTSPAARSAVSELEARLVAAGLEAAHAAEMAAQALHGLESAACDSPAVLARVGRALSGGLSCAGDLIPGEGQRRTLAFVGPTGVGKTTTIAKIAAQAQLMRGRRVGLVALDTFRMAAVEQLARYADILECPLEVVRGPDGLRPALEALSDCDLVLVDTTGRSPRAVDQVEALGRSLPLGLGVEVVLTLAAGGRERDVAAALTAYAALDYAWLCATKLDETDAPGTLYSLARNAGRPLAWVTAGQRVPEDLDVASADALAARILSGALGLELEDSRHGSALAS